MEHKQQKSSITISLSIRFKQVSGILFLIFSSANSVAETNTDYIKDGEYYKRIVSQVEFSSKNIYQGYSVDESFPSKKELIKQGLYSSFALPWHELVEKKYDSEWKNLLQGFSGGFSLGYPLKEAKQVSSNGGSTQGGLEANNVTLSASLKYKLIGNWFINTAFFHYKNKELQAPWNPDFIYTFGYSDWRPYTLSLVYANYGGNRLNPDRSKGERITTFSQGAWTLSWKFPIDKDLSKYFTLTDEGRAGCNIGLTIVPEYFDATSSQLKKWKSNLSLGCKYSITGNWYVNATTFFYPDPSQQQPWNPDFTYGFGYFDWRPGTITVQYNNYSGNRFPWRESSPNTGRFINGGLSISWSWSF